MTDLTREQIEALLDELDANILDHGFHEDGYMIQTTKQIRAQLAEAQAAQAGVVETIQDAVQNLRREAGRNADGVRFQALDDVRNLIRSLADPTGVALLAELRAERDDLAHVLDSREASYGISSNGNMWRFWSEKAMETSARNMSLLAERDTLAVAKAALEARVAELDDRCLVWSHEHGCWWRADSAGYTRDVLAAGVYTREKAMSISHRGRDGWRKGEKPDELPVRVSDLPDWVRAALASGKPGEAGNG